jgi:hypothetical protein
MIIHHFDFSRSFCSDKIVVMHEPSNIEVTKGKLQCLRPRGWLNDEVNSYRYVLNNALTYLCDVRIHSATSDTVCASLQVINLYIQLLKERAEREPRRFLKCHFFNSFFYKKVSSSLCFPYFTGSNAYPTWVLVCDLIYTYLTNITDFGCSNCISIL